MKREELKSLVDELDKAYDKSEKKTDIDFYNSYSAIILESLEIRASKDMSQKELAKRMKTKQSVISRFENMGRCPNYDFMVRLSQALGHQLGLTLYGDFMGIVPPEKQEFIVKLAKELNVSTKDIVQDFLDNAVSAKYESYSMATESDSVTEKIFDANSSQWYKGCFPENADNQPALSTAS